MSCRTEINGTIKYILPNGKDSKLFEGLKTTANTISEAEKIYESVYSEEFTKFYGFDFQKDDVNQIERFANNLDENNEPRLFSGVGIYEFLNSKMESFPVSISNKQKNKILDLNRSSEKENIELQAELINTIIGFINKTKNASGLQNEAQINKYFNIDKDNPQNKGLLAEKVLLAAFNNSIDIEKAKELYNILKSGENGYDKFIQKIQEENVELDSKAWDTFITAYDQWNSTKDSLGNIQTIGVRQLIKDDLSNYNLRLKDGESILEELDDEYVKIYNQSRLEDNPKDKLSGRAKSIISNITIGENSLGYPQTLPIDRVYAIIAEAAVGQVNFEEMISKLDYYSEYKPEVKAIVDRLNSLKAAEKAVIFSSFKNTYKNFIIFKQEKQSDGTYKNLIINSNQNQFTAKTKQDYKDNAIEYITPNPRAIYKEIENKLTVKPEKLRRIKNAWEIVKQTQGKAEWSTQEIDALGVYLWELGMNYGPTLETTQENLKRYYNLGNESKITEGDLFASFVFSPNQSFEKLLLTLEQDSLRNFHDTEGSIIKKIADVSILFDSKPFGSFISVLNKQYYPVNLPTSADELMELFNDPKQIDNLKAFLQELKQDPFFVPGPIEKYKSLLLRALTSSKGNARENFILSYLDGYKNSRNDASDYESQNTKISLLERMIGFINRDSNFSLSSSHIQADRKNLPFTQVPKISKLSKFGITITNKEIIEGFIIQDLARINQARKLIRKAQKNQDPSNLIEGYHYKKGSEPYTQNGSVFTMTQIYKLEDTEIGHEYMSDLVESFVTNKDFAEKTLFQKMLDQKVAEVEKMLEGFEQEMQLTLANFNIELIRDVDSSLNNNEKKLKFIKDFIFEDFVSRIEVTKLLRSGYSFARDEADFYKRMGLVGTPGSKLAIQGFDQNDPEFGMMPQYNALVIKDFNYTDKERAAEIEATLIANGLNPDIAKLYGPNNLGLKKTDAQSFISVDMYRGIMQGGIGNWSDLDKAAYQEYLAGGDFSRPVMPLKPYHEQTNVKNSLSTLHMDKNSYTVVTPQLAREFPYLQTMLNTMREDNIHVVHTESATKGAKINIQDFQNTQVLDASNPMVMDSSKLRFPQILPTTSKGWITFNRQIRKNLTTNIIKDGDYNIGGNIMKGFEVQEIFGEAVAENIKEDTKIVQNLLGLTKLNKIKAKDSVEYKEAKLEHLQKLRAAIEQEIIEKDLPQNYLDGLDIVPNGMWDYKFKIPLSFPHYSSKYETIISGIYNKEIYKQKLKGQEVVQIAELGGHVTSGELKMYDGSNGGAEVRIKASILGFTPEELEGKTIEDFAGDPRLEFIGYRIPQQGKSSAIVMKVVDFLPESYDKAIMVPGGLTIQQGSDFDIDKLNLIFREREQFKKLSPRQERNNTIYDVFKGILLDSKHLEEVMTPVTSEELSLYAKEIRAITQEDTSINYNNPLAELKMEEIQKMGIAGRGLHSNGIAGRNVAETLGTLRIDVSASPMIDNDIFSVIRMLDINGKYTDANISQYLSAAVDAAKDPIQIDINDNTYTIPVALLMLSVGIPIKTVVYFLAQPSIKNLIKTANLNNTSENLFLKDIKTDLVNNMTFSELESNLTTGENQEAILENFALFHKAGKQLQKVYKLITPDNIDNVNELSSINAWVDEESVFLYQDSLILGAEDYIVHQQGTKKPLNPIGIAYRGILNTILNDTSQLGFIQNSAAFKQVKENIKEDLDILNLSAAQHKFIDRALYTSLMAQPHSPLMLERGERQGLMSRTVIKRLYNPNDANNIVTQIIELKLKYPKLNDNAFFKLLKADSSNKETGLALIQLDSGTNLSTADKNELSNALLSLINDPIAEISNFGKLLVANQLITHGFSPTYGSYIDLIPSEVLLTDILNPGNGSPVDFFEQEIEGLINPNYLGFSTFVHEFVRNYGTLRPGKRSFLQLVKFENEETVAYGQFTFTDLDSRVYNKNTGYIKYFKTKNDTMYVYREGSTYQQLSPLGVSKKINEIGITNQNSESTLNQNRGPNTTDQIPNTGYINITEDTIPSSETEDPTKICKQ